MPKPTGQLPSGPPPRYTPITEVVTHIWRAAEQLCGKRLVAALPLWLPHYAKHFNPLLPCQRKLLNEVSAATLDRLLRPHRVRVRHGLCATKPGSLLRTHVPLQGEVWDERRVGFLEADSVAHCGESLAGNFAWSMIYTDLASTWTAGRAVWNKGATGVLAQTRDVEERLPFALRGFDCDNGSEWLNWHLIRHPQQRRQPVALSRSRPYHKNDNAHVEQKNWMWPRQLFGYGRLGQKRVVAPMNTLYIEVWEPLQNFFLYVLHSHRRRVGGCRHLRSHNPAHRARAGAGYSAADCEPSDRAGADLAAGRRGAGHLVPLWPRRASPRRRQRSRARRAAGDLHAVRVAGRFGLGGAVVGGCLGRSDCAHKRPQPQPRGTVPLPACRLQHPRHEARDGHQLRCRAGAAGAVE